MRINHNAKVFPGRLFRWGLMMLLILVSGCTSRFLYNHADWVVSWYLDDYVELTSSQSDSLDRAVMQWIDWHRNSELPRYKDQLLSIQALVAKPEVSNQQIEQHLEDIRSLWRRLRQHLTPDIAHLGMQLTPSQWRDVLAHLEKKQRTWQKKREDRSASEQFDKNVDDLTDELEQWTGRLQDAQTALVKKQLQCLAPTFDDWLTYRRQWQQAVADWLETPKRSESDLQRILLHNQDYMTANYRHKQQQNQQCYVQLLSQLIRSLNDKQIGRAHV